MAMLSHEVKNQQLVIKHLQEGFELIETKVVDQQGLIYLLGREQSGYIDVIVVSKGEAQFKKQWKKDILVNLRLFLDQFK